MTRCRAREACLPRRDRPREASRTAPRTGTPGRWSRDGVEEGVRNSTRVRRRPLRVETILRRGVMTRTRRRGRRRGCTHQRQHRELVYLSSPRRPPRRRLVALVHRAAPRARERRSDEQHLPGTETDDSSLLLVHTFGHRRFFRSPTQPRAPTMRAVRLLAGLAFASLLFTAVSCQDADDELPPLLQACRAQVRRPSGSGYFRDRTVRFRAVRAPHVPSTHPPSPPRLPRSSSRSSRTSPRSSTPTAPS